MFIRRMIAVVAVVLACAFVVPAAFAVYSSEITLIQSFPTDSTGGDRTKSIAGDENFPFQIRTSYWPSTTTCSLNGGTATPCSWVYIPRGLRATSSSTPTTADLNTIAVTQTDPMGVTTSASYSYVYSTRTEAPSRALSAQGYCRLQTAPANAFPGAPGADKMKEVVLYGGYNASTTPITLGSPSTGSTRITYTTQSVTFDGTNNSAVFGTGSLTYPKIYAPGATGPFRVPMQATLLAANGEDLTPPSIEITSTVNRSRFSVPANYASCFRVLPPAGIVDNDDGTYSATFGWVNMYPIAISTAKGYFGPWSGPNLYSRPAQYVGLGNYLTTPADVDIMDAGQPYYFPGNSTGTWTYTWTDDGSLYSPGDAGRDPQLPFTWTVGGDTTGFYVRRALATHHTQAPSVFTPFTHANATTPITTPAVPASSSTDATGSTKPSTAPASVSGGNPGRRTTLKVTARRTYPRRVITHPGHIVRIDVTIRNTGTVDAVGGRICDVIPVGAVIVAATARSQIDKRKVCWTGTRLAAGSAVTGYIKLRFPDTTKARRVVNRITASATNARPSKARVVYRIVPARPEPVTG